MKPGVKTTEFWLTLVGIITSAVLAANVFPSDSPWTIAMTAIVTVLGMLGYTKLRTDAKVNANGTEVFPMVQTDNLEVNAGLNDAGQLEGDATYHAGDLGITLQKGRDGQVVGGIVKTADGGQEYFAGVDAEGNIKLNVKLPL
jgi:hypothetical protein